MQCEIEIEYKGSKAQYRIEQEGANIFQAELISYENEHAGNQPPQNLMLIKGIRGWIGSSDDTHFLHQIGSSIEHRFSSTDSIYPDQYHFNKELHRGSAGSPDATPSRQG